VFTSPGVSPHPHEQSTQILLASLRSVLILLNHVHTDTEHGGLSCRKSQLCFGCSISILGGDPNYFDFVSWLSSVSSRVSHEGALN
jgi:hypothetical protein